MKYTSKKLFVQTIIFAVIIFLIFAVIGGFGIYYATSNLYLGAKEEIMIKDLEHEKENLTDTYPLVQISELYDKFSDKVKEDATEEEADTYYRWAEENAYNNVFDIEGAPEKVQLFWIKNEYYTLQYEFNFSLKNLSYDRLCLIDLYEDNKGSIYFKGIRSEYNQQFEDTEQLYASGFEIKKHPALKKLVSGKAKGIVFEKENNSKISRSYYNGYIPIYDESGELRFAICVSYNWSAFRRQLVKNLMIFNCTFLSMFTVVIVLLLILVNRSAIKPIKIMQKNVRMFMNDKDSSVIVENLKKIKSKNELGVLSRDISDLALEVDRYIDDLEDSKQKFKKLNEETMEALAKTIDAKDEYTNGHSSRVAIYSRMIAMHMGLSDEDQYDIYYMGLLHDIGKIGIPDMIINKTSKLTDSEFNLIQSHPKFGYNILSEIDSHPDLALAARWHHENYDGTGYPDGKKGDEIPLKVRIIAVADSYDAMTSNRSYRKYLPQDVARAELEKNAGTQFDPMVVKCMIKIIDEDKNYMLHE